MEMLMIIYTMIVYPGIIGGMEDGALSIFEGIIEILIAITIQLVICKSWIYFTRRKKRTREGVRH